MKDYKKDEKEETLKNRDKKCLKMIDMINMMKM